MRKQTLKDTYIQPWYRAYLPSPNIIFFDRTIGCYFALCRVNKSELQGESFTSPYLAYERLVKNSIVKGWKVPDIECFIYYDDLKKTITSYIQWA